LLAAALDLPGVARTTQPPQVVRVPEDLDPHPRELAARAETVVQVVLAERAASPGAPTERALTAYATPEGLYLLHGWSLDGEGEVVLQRVGPQALEEAATAFLTGRATASR
jgi:hypothetical protein